MRLQTDNESAYKTALKKNLLDEILWLKSKLKKK